MKTINLSLVIPIIAACMLGSCAKNTASYEEWNTISINKSSITTRNYDEAKAFAESALSLLGEDTKSPSRRIASGECITTPSTKTGSGQKDTLCYVFNFADEEGFAIINADSRKNPFICITEQGSYVDGVPTGVEGFDFFINQVKDSLAYNRQKEKPDSLIRGIGDPITPDPPAPFSYFVDWYDGDYVNPLLQTKWGKNGIYGAFCPNGAAGCVARSVAQIMAFHQYPSSIILSADMGAYSSGEELEMPWIFMTVHIQNHAGYQTCSAYHDYISALLYDVSEQLHMIYYPNGNSGTIIDYVPTAFQHYGYQTDGVTSVSIPTIISSLDNSRPVIMKGSTGSVGHNWVADGYKDYLLYQQEYAQVYTYPGYYLVGSTLIEEAHALHINWGWDGNCNGYFNFGSYNTSNAYSYDGNVNPESYNFTQQLAMVANIRH